MTPSVALEITKAVEELTDRVTAFRIITGMGRKLSKLADIAERSASIRKTIDERADRLALRLDAIPAAAETAFAPHEALADETEAGIKSLEDSLRDLAGHNRPPVSGG